MESEPPRSQSLNVPEYLQRISARLARESREIGDDYSHPGAIGRSREDKVKKFLEENLPYAFQISRGFLVSADNVASPETDLLIADRFWAKPLHSDLDNPYWLAESVYASIEVKSSLSTTEISNCINKCKRFKRLSRDWTNAREARTPLDPPFIEDSLFLIWAFDGPSNQTIIDNISSAIEGIPTLERPDLILVNDRFCSWSGSIQLYFQAAVDYFGKRQEMIGEVFNLANHPNIITFECGSYSLVVFLFFLTQWLQRAAPRWANIMNYMKGIEFGPIRFPSNFSR